MIDMTNLSRDLVLPEDLWTHQGRGATDTVAALSAGEKKICYTGCTGSGKSRVMFELIKRIPGNITLYTNRTLLREQLSENLTRAGVEHGLIAAGHEGNTARVQIAMKQTADSWYIRRDRKPHPVDVLLWDEVHNMASGTSLTLREKHGLDCVDIGFTATPAGLGHIYNLLNQDPDRATRGPRIRSGRGGRLGSAGKSNS